MLNSPFIEIYLCIVTIYKASGILSQRTDPWLKKDMCNEYYVRSEEWREMRMAQSDQCDRSMSEGWYRFFTPEGRSAQLPVVCIKNGMCGAKIPLRVDLRGQGLPSEGQTLEIDVCGSYNILGKWDCCVLSQPGYIHNCGGYYVYKLRAPDRCSVGYCILDDMDDVEHLTVKTGEIVSREQPSSYQPDILRPRDIYERDVGNVPPPCQVGQTLCPDGQCIPPSRSCNFNPINFPPTHTTRTPRRSVNRNFTFNVIRRSKPSTQSTADKAHHEVITRLPRKSTEQFQRGDMKEQTSKRPATSSSPVSIISGIDVRIREADKLQPSSEIRTSENSGWTTTTISLEPSYSNSDISKSHYSSSYTPMMDAKNNISSEVTYTEDIKQISSSFNGIKTVSDLNTLQILPTLTRLMTSQVTNQHEKNSTSMSIVEDKVTRSIERYKSESLSSDKMQSILITPSKVASHFISSAIADVISQIANRKKHSEGLTKTRESDQQSSRLRSSIQPPIHPSSAGNRIQHSQTDSLSTSISFRSSVLPNISENENRFLGNDSLLEKPTSTTHAPVPTSTSSENNVAISAVSLKFSTREYYEMSLENFLRELRSVLASAMNIFYTPYSSNSETLRHERSIDLFYKPRDVHIWNTSMQREFNLLNVDLSIKDRNSNQTSYIPPDVLLRFFLRKDVLFYINDIFADFNITLIGVFTEMSANTTEKQHNTTKGSDVSSVGEESWFVENFGLFLIMVVITSSFIVCSALGLWQICSWAKCRRLQRKSGKYYVKCEKAFLREIKHILPVENPLSDAEIMQDEGEMTEQCLHSTFSDLTGDKESMTSCSCYESEETDSLERGWIVPITEFIDDEMFIRNDCTKL